MRALVVLAVVLGLSSGCADKGAADHPAARGDAGGATPAAESAGDLQRLVRESDRVLLVKRNAEGNLKEIAAIKGPAACGAEALLASVNSTFADRPAGETSWLLLLREESDARGGVPRLAPLPETGWFMPATDQVMDDARAALVPPGTEWSGGYAPHSNPPALVKAAWAREPQFDLGRDIVVEVALRNSGTTPITIPQLRCNASDCYPAMKFDVTLPDGRRVILAGPGGASGGDDSPADRTLQPGEVYVHVFRLNRWLPACEQELEPGEALFSRAGRYVFHACYDRVLAGRDASFEVVGGPATQSAPSRFPREGDVLAVGGRRYVLRCLGSEREQGLPTFGPMQDVAKWFVWHQGQGWVIDPLRPDLGAAFTCRRPVVAVSPERSLAVVTLPEERRRPTDPQVLAVVGLKDGELLGRLPGGDRQWAFSFDGRFVCPLRGGAATGWYYFDVQQKQVVSRPLIDARPGAWRYWSGAVLPDGRTLLVSVRVDDKQHRVVRFDPDKPDAVEPVEAMADATAIGGRFGDAILYYTAAGGARLVSATTWRSEAVDAERVRLLQGRRDPSGRLVYCLNSSTGLAIRDTASGKDTSCRFRDGWFFNAATMGVTFSADGRVAVVPTPYDTQLTFVDNNTRKVIQRIQVPVAPAGAFLVEPGDGDGPGDPGTCLVVGTFLPYER